jgi:CHAT domain-containing protein
MNEQRLQAYLNLIEDILSASSEVELALVQINKELLESNFNQVMERVVNQASARTFEILASNHDLIDPGLIMAMKMSAMYQAQEGYLGKSEFLNMLADFLASKLGLLPSTPSLVPKPDLQLNFLLQVLQATSENYNNLQVVYSLLQANLDKLDDNFATVLQKWATATLDEVEAEEAKYIATSILLFGNLIQEFPLGNQAINIEIAIISFKLFAKVITRQLIPLAWAESQYNLGNAYLKRINGDKADNVEVAIKYYLASLEVRTLDGTYKNMAQQWADTQNNLGNAYLARIRGSRTENAEAAIRCFFEGLEIYDEEFIPTVENFIWVAYRISEALELSSISALYKLPNIKSQFSFLLRILVVFLSLGVNQANLELAHPLLQVNVDKLDSNFAKLLQKLATDILGTAESEQKQLIAVSLNLLSNHILQISLGSRISKIEIAIVGYEIAATVFTRNTHPEQWSTIQDGLGTAYCEKFQGDRAENLELGIKYHKLALEVIKPEKNPQVWGLIQNNLATAYHERIRGEQAENLELAITACQLALQVCKLESFPKEWSQIKYNLGNVYRHRIRGNPADNIELAITTYKDALLVRTREALPKKWAMTQNSLGEAYRNRKYGNRSQNIEKAIEAYKFALQVYTQHDFPEHWAMIQHNIGTAYMSIAEIEERVSDERVKYVEDAIKAFEDALQVRTRETLPEKWAMTQQNLGSAYSYLYKNSQERVENLEAAIRSFLAALDVYTREAFPRNYVTTQFNLGNLYQYVKQLNKAYNTFADAIDTLEFLREEILSGSSMEEDKQKLAEEWNQLYQGMVEVCVELGYYNQAIEYVELSKARNLVELIASLNLHSKGDIPVTVIKELNRLRLEIATEQRWLELSETANRGERDLLTGELKQPIDSFKANLPDLSKLNQLRQQLDELISREITPIDPNFRFAQKVESISFSDIQKLTVEKTAIVEWYITGKKLFAFIVTPQSLTPIVWQSSEEDLQTLGNWYVQYLLTYNLEKDISSQILSQLEETTWEDKLASHLERLTKLLHLDEILSYIPPSIGQLVLIPNQFLHLFPLHALEGKRLMIKGESEEYHTATGCLLELFPGGVRYAPSCQLLQQTQAKHCPNFDSLFAVQDPTQDLLYSNLEVETIQKYFKYKQILKKEDANKTNFDRYRQSQNDREQGLTLGNAHCLHFSCHGYFHLENPLLSALVLTDSRLPDDRHIDLTKCLTLVDLFTLDLSSCRLVTLSACETGLTEDYKSHSDQYIGLPSDLSSMRLASSSNQLPDCV